MTQDFFHVFVTWIHIIASVIWIGGSIFYFLILNPVLNTVLGSSNEVTRIIGKEFSSIVKICIAALIVSGVIMLLNRLVAPDSVNYMYLIIFSIKIIIFLWMILIITRHRRSTKIVGRTTPKGLTFFEKIDYYCFGYSTLVLLAIFVYFLSNALRIIF